MTGIWISLCIRPIPYPHRKCKDLAEAFFKQYRYNMDMAPDRTELQNMKKKSTESFKEYAQRWRDKAAQVQPAPSNLFFKAEKV